MSLLEQEHLEGAGVQEYYKIYETYEITKALPVTPNGLHPQWLDL